MNKVEYYHCHTCGFEGEGIEVAYRRRTANGEWYACPLCGHENSAECEEEDW